MKLSPGDRLGIYEIIVSVGRGGMGEVYRARDLQLGRDVAIKVLAEEYAQHESRMKRFTAEAKAASALNHPNITTVYGIGEENQIPYIVMEFIDGSTLRQLMNSPIPISRAYDIAMQTLAGLSKAHTIGIVHRDLKPENLMITKDGFVKILDFGLAKLLKDESTSSNRQIETLGITATETGLVMGTAAYMSPEQARGQHADARSDIFSLGLIIYEMLAGKHPFWRTTPIDTMSAILRDDPTPLSLNVANVPTGLEQAVHKALEKKPEDRFPDASAFENALRGLRLQISTLENQPTLLYDTKVPGTQIPAAATPKQNNAKVFLIVVLSMLAAIAALVYDFRLSPGSSVNGPLVVAVMAIDNKTTDPELAKADVGRILSDAFVQVLYDCKGVQVVSPVRLQSVIMGMGRKFNETAQDFELASDVGKKSEANTILSGSLSQLGQTFILNATLTLIPGEKLLGSYQSQSASKDKLLDNLTSVIAARLKETLSGKGGKPIEGGRKVDEVATGSMEAYSHYVKGLDLNSEGRFLEAADEIRKALEIDPSMGVAWSELACIYSFAGEDMKAQEAQNSAVKLRDHLSRKEKLWVDSISLWLDGNGPAYRAGVEKYTKEFPDDRNGYFYIGLGWQWLDHDCKQAIPWYEKAYQLTPDYYPVTKALIDCEIELKQRQQAIASLQRYQKVVHSGFGFDQARWRLEKLQKQ
jgi:serine/threonine protein kinase